MEQFQFYLTNGRVFEAEAIIDALAELYRLDRRIDGSNFKTGWSDKKRKRIGAELEDSGLNLLTLKRCPNQFNTVSYVALQRKRYEAKLRVIQVMLDDKAERAGDLSQDEAAALMDRLTNKVRDAEMILKNVIEVVSVPEGTDHYQNSYQLNPAEALCASLHLLAHYIEYNLFYPGINRQSALADVI